MQSILNLSKTNKLILAAFAFLAVLAFSGGRAHAATINVTATSASSASSDGQCSLYEAIENTNDQAQTNADCAGGSGNDDTILLPAGTISVDGNLPSFTAGHDVTIQGAGSDNSAIDANGYQLLRGNDLGSNLVFSGFKVTEAFNAAMDINGDNTSITLDDIEAENSIRGIRLTAVTIQVTNSSIHDNTNPIQGNDSGLILYMNAINNTDDISVYVSNTRVENNTGKWGGLYIEALNHTAASMALTVRNTSVLGNHGQDGVAEGGGAGIRCLTQFNPAELTLDIDATTVANNSIEGTEDLTSNDYFGNARIVGFQLSVSNLIQQYNFRNVTVAGNSIVNNIDNAMAVAGFFATPFNLNTPLSIVNTTVVNNSVIQTTLPNIGILPSFTLMNAESNGGPPTGLSSAGEVRNSLLSNNLYNGNPASCINDFDAAGLGLGVYDLTPANGGNNMTDDANCTGYIYEANLYNTIDHEVADNGGPVPTIALHDDSPARGGGGQVLGISTDARGIVRPASSWDIGAYQYVLGSDTSVPVSGGVTAPNTGAKSNSIMMTVLALVLGLPILGYAVKKHV